MTGVQHHKHDAYSVIPRTPSPHRLAKLAPSADRHCQMQPALSILSKVKLPKNVRWATETVDNENRARAAPVIASGANKSIAKPSSNTSAKISPWRRQSPLLNQGYRSRPSSTHPRRGSSRTRPSPAVPPLLPRVPDAPRPKPPPAPRPARLPTPDLPEIDGDYFVPAGEIVKKVVLDYSKMDAQRTFPLETQSRQIPLTRTVEAAMAYMNQGKKRR